MSPDTVLAYAAGDPGFGMNPSVVHVAYTNNQAGAVSTTLYGIDSTRDVLVTVGGLNGTPSPNGGQLFSVGPLGADVSTLGGFDIQPATNSAYAALNVGGISRLFAINLSTGFASLVGTIGTGSNVDGLTVAACTTAAGVGLSGRVLTSGGHGIRNARITLTGGSLSAPRVVTTGSMGYYFIDDLDVGETYIVSIESRRFTFNPPIRVINLMDELTVMDFVAEPQE